MTNTQIQLTLTVEQSATLHAAMDTYTRLCLGQLEDIREMVANGTIKAAIKAATGGGT